jgi:hypothetical protein
VGPISAEVEGIPLRQGEVLAVDVDLERAVEHEDQLLPGVLHRLVAAVGSRLHRGDGAGEDEAAVGAGDAGQLYPAVGCSSTKYDTGRLNATAIFSRVVMVGTMPPRSSLWMAAADTSD